MKDLQERFEEKFEPVPWSGCWEWTASRMKQGYGRIGINGRNFLASRVSYELYRGPISENICVLHHCDNPSCVNPNHLFLGTKADNNSDKIRKGRSADVAGSKNGRAILNEEQVKAILQDHRLGTVIAKEYGVTPGTISHIRNHRTWQR